jgi:hypothetical protein
VVEEGEFKKRLQEKASEYAKLDETNHYVASKLDVLQTVENWVDEAKKEFEKLIIVRKNNNPLLDSDEILDWFVKWFGETEK